MSIPSLILLVFAFVCFVSVAVNFPRTDPPNYAFRVMSAGLAFWVAVQLFGGFFTK